MQLYRIGPARGPQRIGYARDPEALKAKMEEGAPKVLTIRTWDLPTGRAMLVYRLLRLRLANRESLEGWFDAPIDLLEAHIVRAVVETGAEQVNDLAVVRREDHARAMQHLRTKVFETTQEMMGVIAGRSVAIVSRWESGASTPGLDELLRLRAFALAVGIPWEDSLLLNPPQT